ncbi:DUF3363 domain-containing protein [Bradyrhizobium sp. USDA 4486]
MVHDITRKLHQEITADRLARLDRSILRDAGGVLSGREPAWQMARIGRLRALERMGLADETEPGRWRIDPELEPKLRRMGERGDIIKTMHREMAAVGVSRAASDYTIFGPEPSAHRLVGRVVGEGLRTN